MLLVIDNYDSFTFNLVQMLGALGAEPEVVRNDELPVEELRAMRPDRVVISPGPGAPSEAGVSVGAIRAFAEEGVPLLGVCLGHQALGEAFGGRTVRAGRTMHGKVGRVRHSGEGIFAGLPRTLEVARYHSLVTDRTRLPNVLVPVAWSADAADDGEVQAMRHRRLPLWGVQFHPESHFSRWGDRLLGAFLRL